MKKDTTHKNIEEKETTKHDAHLDKGSPKHDLPKHGTKDWAKIAENANFDTEKSKAKKSDEIRQNINTEEESKDSPLHIKLTHDLETALQEKNALREQLLTSAADLENARRIFERDLSNAHKYAIDKLVTELLPVLDSLEMGLSVKIDHDSKDLGKQLHRGMEMTLDILLKVLKKHGIKQLDPQGEPFDPAHHEAMGVQEAPGIKANTILKVVQKGYLLKDRLVRPAMVIVAKE